MAGILDYSDPNSAALLGLTTGLLQAGGPSRMPVSFGQSLAQGLLASNQMQQAARNAQLNAGYVQAQTQHLANTDRMTQLQIDAAMRNQALIENILRQSGFMGGGTTQPDTTAQPDNAPGFSPSSSQAVFGTPAYATPQPTQPQPTSAQPAAGVQPNASSRGAFPFTPTQLTALKLAGMDLTGVANYAQPNVEMRNGYLYDKKTGNLVGTVPTTNPQGFSTMAVPDANTPGGWRVVQVPGGSQAFANQQDITERAKAGYDLIPVPVGPRGETQLMTRADAARFIGGRSPSAAPVGGAPSMPAPRIGASPTMGPQAAPTPLGYTRSPVDTGAESSFSSKLAGGMADIYAGLLQTDYQAPTKIADYQRLGALLGSIDTGKYKGTITNVKSAAKTAGIDLDALGITDDVAPAQASVALSNAMALQLRNPTGGAGMPGSLSDKDREFLQSMVPGLETVPGANKFLVDYRIRLEQRSQQVAKLARAYKKQNGVFDDGFYGALADWSAAHPLFTEKDARDVAALSGRKAASVPSGVPTATNPKTGERVMFKDGQWQPIR